MDASVTPGSLSAFVVAVIIVAVAAGFAKSEKTHGIIKVIAVIFALGGLVMALTALAIIPRDAWPLVVVLFVIALAVGMWSAARPIAIVLLVAGLFALIGVGQNFHIPGIYGQPLGEAWNTGWDALKQLWNEASNGFKKGTTQ